MIPQSYLTEWRAFAPWIEFHQVEQDLILSKALVQLYSDPFLQEAFAFRGGTALQKLFFTVPTRYSEDIDLVQLRKEAIGPAIDAIRKHLDSWLGKPKVDLKTARATLVYRFQSEVEPVVPMRLKIEVNNGEHFTVLNLKKKNFEVRSSWFQGATGILTYEIEELLGTKLRALYQRKKGRDLYDMSMALRHFESIDPAKIIACFQHYMKHQNLTVSRAQYEANLSAKLQDKAFLNDIHVLLSPGSPKFDAPTHGATILKNLISLLPGEPWKGAADRRNEQVSKRS